MQRQIKERETRIGEARGRKIGARGTMTRRRRMVGLLPLLLLAFALGCDQQTPPASSAQDNVHILPPLTMESLQRSRTIRIYLPPGYAESDKRYPVLYMHDGQNLFDDATSYVGEWGVDETLNALVQSHGLELIVVGVDHGNEHRITELNPFDHEEFGAGEGQAYVEFLVEQLKPQIDRDYRTLPDRANTAVMGSSMGGLISHFAITQYPQTFGRAGVFSPSYWAAPQMYAQASNALPQGTRLYLLMGGDEGPEMVDGYRKMRELLQQTLPDSHWQAKLAAGGKHNEAFWHSELTAALLWLFAPASDETAG